MSAPVALVPFLAVLLAAAPARATDPCATAPSAVAQDLGAAVTAPPALTETAALLQRLEETAKGAIFDVLANESTTSAITAIRIEGDNLSVATKADAARALATIGVKAKPRKDFPVFTSPTEPDPENEGRSLFERMVEADPNTGALVEALRTGLKDLKVMVIGEDSYDHGAEHDVFILGTAPDGSLVGIRTTVVWT